MSKFAGVKEKASGEAEATALSLQRKGSLGFRGAVGFGLQQPASGLLGGGDEVEEAEIRKEI